MRISREEYGKKGKENNPAKVEKDSWLFMDGMGKRKNGADKNTERRTTSNALLGKKNKKKLYSI